MQPNPSLVFFAFIRLGFALFCLPVLLAEAPRAQHVFIVSFDQAAPFNIEAASMPVFKKLATEGAHTWEAFTIVPSLTLPSHVSMLTGVGVQKHQVTWNDWDPAKPILTVPTIFQLARTHGLSTALVASKEKFKTFEAAGGIDFFELPDDYLCDGIAAAAIRAIKATRPNLMFIHFGDPDFAGHLHGVRSQEKLAALAACDAAFGRIQAAIAEAGLADSSVFILTADHGGHDRSAEENELRAKRGLAPQPGTHGDATSDDVTIPWVAAGKSVKSSYTVTAPVLQYDTAATALWLLGVPLPAHFWGRPVVSAFD
ncbi:phosphodiesterase [bacterium]|nr:phosphodiesterase [bacterium]